MTSRIPLVGQIQRPGQKPENVQVFVNERPDITSDERAASIEWVDNRFYPGDPRRYGATMDGSTDDGGPIGRWIDVGLQGVPLFLPEGTALCTTWTQKSITADLTIISDAGVLKGTASHEFLLPEGGDVRIRGVTFDTWLSVVENDAGDSGTTDYLEIKDCVFTNLSGDCISHIRPFNYVHITGNRFETCADIVIRLGTDTYADQDKWQRMVITDNICKTVTSATNCSFALGCPAALSKDRPSLVGRH